jgi:phage gp29-like protein
MPDGTVTLADGGPAQAVATQIKTSAADQTAVDELLNSLSADQLQAQLEGDLRPVIELIESAASYEYVQEKLASLFPKMDDAALEASLSKAMFLADVKGRMATSTVKAGKK